MLTMERLLIRFSIVVLLLLLNKGHQLSAQSLSLDSCYALAKNNYPMVRQFELIEKSREFTLKNASKAHLPQIDLSGIVGYTIGDLSGAFGDDNDFRFFGLGLIRQTIWDGGATKTQKEIIKAAAETEKASLEVSLYELRSRVNQLYFGILMIDEQLDLLAQRETILNKNAERVRQLTESGLAYTTDLDEIKVELLKLNQQKIEYEYVKQAYLQMLTLLTGVEINEQTALEKPKANNFLPEITLARPELELYESQRNLIDAESNRRQVSLMPKIGLLGAGVLVQPEIEIGSSDLSFFSVLGLSVNWSIAGLYRNPVQKKLNRLALERIDSQEETFRFNTNLQVTQISADIQKQQAILAEDEEIVRLRSRIREGYQLKYINGVSSLLELLEATEKEGEAKTQKALHEMQLLKALYEYKTLSGYE
jgi:outer membrane protein TolC